LIKIEGGTPIIKKEYKKQEQRINGMERDDNIQEEKW
jgi:hypothetical protein